MASLYGIIFFLLAISNSCAHPNTAYLADLHALTPLDVIQIDSGTKRAFRGILNMPKSKGQSWHKHGTWMAEALESELQLLKTKPIYGLQIIYDQWDGDTVITALRKASKLNTKVISMSFGGLEPVTEELHEIIVASDRGILLLAAAGNTGGNYAPHFPGSYKGVDCLLSVGTLDATGKRAKWSHPVADVWLPYRKSDTTGTSPSTARVAAHAIKIWQKFPKKTCKEVKKILKLKLRKPKR